MPIAKVATGNPVALAKRGGSRCYAGSTLARQTSLASTCSDHEEQNSRAGQMIADLPTSGVSAAGAVARPQRHDLHSLRRRETAPGSMMEMP
jgi:hypothetical protein